MSRYQRRYKKTCKFCEREFIGYSYQEYCDRLCYKQAHYTNDASVTQYYQDILGLLIERGEIGARFARQETIELMVSWGWLIEDSSDPQWYTLTAKGKTIAQKILNIGD